jgi:hypothetical protein
MANRLVPKHSTTPSAVPTTGQLVDGELAVNINDGTLFLRMNNGTPAIQQIGAMSAIVTNRILGNNSGSTASPSALTPTQVTAMLNQFSSSLQGVVPASGGGTTNFLRADGSWVAPTAAPMVGDSGSGGTGGSVPAPGAGTGATNKTGNYFLRANGTWTQVAGFARYP